MIDEFQSLQHRKSLPPPGRTATTWEDYIGAAPGLAPPLGRQQIVKQNTKSLKALIAMVGVHWRAKNSAGDIHTFF